MTNLQLAIEVWGHLGQYIESISDDSKESRNFNRLLSSSRRRVVLNTAPSSFLSPFRSNLIYDISDTENPFKDSFYVWLYPQELVQAISNIQKFSQVFQNVSKGYFRPAYDPIQKQKILLTKEENFIFIGLFDIKNLDYWNDQFIETLSLYMAWLLAPIANSGSGTDRDRLRREHALSETKSKIYSNMEVSSNSFYSSSIFSNLSHLTFTDSPSNYEFFISS